MTNTLFSLSPGGPNGVKQIIYLLMISSIALLLGNLTSRAQTTVYDASIMSQTHFFQSQPAIKLFPFNSQVKIKSFNPTKNFERLHFSELDLKVMLYPNPATEAVTISIPDDGLISLTSTTGQVIDKRAVTTGEVSLDISSLSEGVYLIQLSTSDESFTKRLVVRH